jgi:catechol 2,3-dioxygenase-like lactoylglutathione lyase family enzyme
VKEPASSEAGPLSTVAPEFFVQDLDASIRFYVEKLGFAAVRREPDFAVLALGRGFVLLAAEGAVREHNMPRADEWLAGAPRGIGVNVLMMIPDVDALHRRATANGATIAKEIGDRSFGLRDFIVADPDGYLLRFGAPIAR